MAYTTHTSSSSPLKKCHLHIPLQAFYKEKKSSRKPHRKPRENKPSQSRPTTWTTPQEVSGLTIELLHREKIVKKKHVLGNQTNKVLWCFFFDSHCSRDSCAALLLFCPLVAAFVNFFGGDANIYVRSMCSRTVFSNAHTCTEQLRSREQQVHFFWKLCTNGLVPDCFLVLGLDNIMSMRSKTVSNAARLGPLLDKMAKAFVS